MKSLTKLKRVAVMLLAMLVMLTAMIPMKNISAAELTTTLRVTGMGENSTIYAYAIVLDAVDDSGNHYWKYNEKGEVEKRLKDGSITEDTAYFYTNLNTASGAEAHDGKGKAVVDETVLEFDNKGNGVYETYNVKPGLYVITASDGLTYKPMIVAVNYKYDGNGVASIDAIDGVVTIAAKLNGIPSVEKYVVEGDKNYKYGDAEVGDTVEFKIDVSVPAYDEAFKNEHLHYRVNDTLTEGLTRNKDSIKITGTSIGEYTFKSASSKYTVTDNTLTIDLYGEDVWQFESSNISITYNAVVNEKAGVNFDNEENKVYVEYTNQAGGDDLVDTDIDRTYHYTFGIDTTVNGMGSETTTEITKYGVKSTTEINNKVVLKGAKFQLLDENNKVLKFDNNGKLSTDSNANNYIVSGTNGELTATGLDAGTYYLKELTAPEGYALNTTTYTIVIAPTYAADGQLQNYKVTVNGQAGTGITFTHEKLSDGSISNTDNAADSDTFGIINTPLTTLPSTGGRGIIVVSGIAVVIMAVCGSMFMVTSRKKKDEKNC